MISSDRVLTLDVGASHLQMAEFSTKNPSEPILVKFASRQLPTTDSPEEAIAKFRAVLKQLFADNKFSPAPVIVSLPGQTVFPRYVKMPPVSSDKIAEMVVYEAEQNVPFPINEVVWDYQILGDTDEEVNAFLVAVKRESVKELTDSVQAVGLNLEMVDAAPLALYNAVRFNYPDLDGCTMVLDIGAKGTNLIFIEDDKIFIRNILVGGNNITQEIAKGLNITQFEAEELKIESGYVSLGGVYAMTDDERAEKISKIARNVITRLHAEVNRSINFYRSQQGGSAPKRVLLTGGASLMPYTDTFFREKLQVDVEYFNPFVNVALADPVDENDTAAMAKLMQLGCSVGLALRACMQCPIELTLLPPEIVSQKALKHRVPYFIISAAGVVIAILCWFFYAKQLSGTYKKQHDVVQERYDRMDNLQRQMASVASEQAELQEKLELLEAMAANRNAYSAVLEVLRQDMPKGVWLTGIRPGQSAPGVKGYDVLTVSGMAYEDELLKSAPDGTAAVSKYLSKLLDGEKSLFVATTRDPSQRGPDAATVSASTVTRTKLDTSRAFREFELMLRLKRPLGLPTQSMVASSAEGGQD